MRIDNRDIVAIAVTRPQTFEHILRGFVFTDRVELAVIESMRIVGPAYDYQAWVNEVMDAANQIEPRVDWPAWWRETIATQERLLGRIREHKERQATR